MKNFSIRLLLPLFLGFLFISSSVAGPGKPFKTIVFFGDSLSDNGNLYSDFYGYIPKSPPYFKGRFSNGIVWSEYAEKYFYEKNFSNTVNYAVGGETAVFHNPRNGFLPYSLGASLDSYLLRTFYRDRSKTLFVIWIGSNDYLNGSDNPEQLTTDVVASIKATTDSLVYHGGLNFLIINVPDFSRTPMGMEGKMSAVLKQLATLHNEKLKKAVEELQNNYKSINIKLFDLNSFFVDLLDHVDTYNAKYNTHISHLTEACWNGGYTATQNRPETEEQIYQEILAKKKVNALLKTEPKEMHLPKQMDDRQLAHYIVISPALMEAHRVNHAMENGGLRCKDPDSYIYWDHVHPTAIIHQLMGNYLTNYIEQNFEMADRINK